MTDTLGYIPQVFYDLIGRIAPGTAFLTLGAILLAVDSKVIVSDLQQLPAFVLSILALACPLVTYVTGFVLGAIGSVLEDGPKQPPFCGIRQTPPNGQVQEADIPYIYDFILIHNPGAGARLAKLRAESHMCGALIAGCLVLAIAYTTVHRNRMDVDEWLVVISLIIGAIPMFLFQRHLRTRGWRLQINCWLILTNQQRGEGTARGLTTAAR